MPTLDEVARLAGVSRATASRAINGGSRVSAKAAEAVAEAVQALGYLPNPAARSLVTRRTETIAMVVPESDERVFADPFFARTLHVVTQVLAQRDLQVVLLIAQPGDEMQRTLRYLRGGHVDGAIVVSHHRNDALADHLAAIGLPAAFIGRPLTGAEKVFYTDPDNIAGAREVTNILIERGCRRIGTITGPVDMSAGMDRAAGWRSALDAAGLASDAVVEGDFTEDGGEAACEILLRDHPDIDGLMVASDLMAAGALRVLERAGRRVPDDIAVVGYDDLGIAERTTPPLTTVKNPIGDMAREAVRLLLAQLDGGTTIPRRVVFAPELVRRTSA
ncbi:LacI family DNA-binding transcriptional regulator [Nocardioides sp. CCNWLW239]|uniref:LacI family DNA-binding transcriptional regulator n=1 Tax=Nocardioides sp. CCNWLW239 TaxID=3128902 RepID=UPI0030164C88